MPKTAMLLAAGLGTRMLPITADVPKPLVQVGGRPLIDHALNRLAEVGVETVVVNVHHLADQIAEHIGTRQWPRIVVSDETQQLMDTGGGVVKALPMLGADPFFLMNSDTLWMEGPTPNLVALADAWSGDRMDAVLMLAPTVTAIGYEGPGDFDMDPIGRLVPRAERRVAPFVYTGVSIVDPSRMFARAPKGPFSLNALIGQVSAAGRLFGIRMDGTWFHVGTAASIEQAERVLSSIAA